MPFFFSRRNYTPLPCLESDKQYVPDEEHHIYSSNSVKAQGLCIESQGGNN